MKKTVLLILIFAVFFSLSFYDASYAKADNADAEEEPAEIPDGDTPLGQREANNIFMDNSPEWVGRLAQAQDARQLFVVAAVGDTAAWISFHQKDDDGVWKQILTTSGCIGKKGLGKEREGDEKTPVGTFRFDLAFGIEADPGCALDYYQVTDDDYWSGDQRDGYHYNEMVSIRDYPDLNRDVSERIMDSVYTYRYCLNISYNEEGTPGRGSAIFLHCQKPSMTYTGGCVAIPTEQMITVMKNLRPDCVVVIDSLENLSRKTWEDP